VGQGGSAQRRFATGGTGSAECQAWAWRCARPAIQEGAEVRRLPLAAARPARQNGTAVSAKCLEEDARSARSAVVWQASTRGPVVVWEETVPAGSGGSELGPGVQACAGAKWWQQVATEVQKTCMVWSW